VILPPIVGSAGKPSHWLNTKIHRMQTTHGEKKKLKRGEERNALRTLRTQKRDGTQSQRRRINRAHSPADVVTKETNRGLPKKKKKS